MEPHRLAAPVDGAWNIQAEFGAVGPWWTTYGHHTGLDFGKLDGEPVRACESGEVIYAGDNKSFGITVMVWHGWGYTLYAHLSMTAVRAGDRVNTGDFLGTVGSTGLATGPHLHLGLYPADEYEDNGSGGAVDPMPWLTYVDAPAPRPNPPTPDRFECDLPIPGLYRG